MSRDAPAQLPPEQGRDYSGLPSKALGPGQRLVRAHRADREWGWFSSEDGRFDLAEPLGTLYAAADVETAIRERRARAGADNVITRDRAEATTVTVFSGVAANVAAVSAHGSARHGIIGELTSGVPYEISQEWAWVIHGAGFGGIEYTPRFTPGGTAWALFGEAGEHLIGYVLAELDGVEAAEAAGFEVLDTHPNKEGLTIASPPAEGEEEIANFVARVARKDFVDPRCW